MQTGRDQVVGISVAGANRLVRKLSTKPEQPQ